MIGEKVLFNRKYTFCTLDPRRIKASRFAHATRMGKRINKKFPLKGIVRQMKSRFDVDGSYTGRPESGEKPVQDADDL